MTGDPWHAAKSLKAIPRSAFRTRRRSGQNAGSPTLLLWRDRLSWFRALQFRAGVFVADVSQKLHGTAAPVLAKTMLQRSRADAGQRRKIAERQRLVSVSLDELFGRPDLPRTRQRLPIQQARVVVAVGGNEKGDQRSLHLQQSERTSDVRPLAVEDMTDAHHMSAQHASRNRPQLEGGLKFQRFCGRHSQLVFEFGPGGFFVDRDTQILKIPTGMNVCYVVRRVQHDLLWPKSGIAAGNTALACAAEDNPEYVRRCARTDCYMHAAGRCRCRDGHG